MEATELATTRNKAGATKAAKLIAAGKITESGKWKGPSNAAQDKYIEANGWAKYGAFHLGQDKDFPADTKAHWKYPFSADFASVSLNGLRAIRTRAAQTEEDEIFATAGKLLDAAKEKAGVEEEELAPRWLPRAPWLPAAPRLPRAKRLPPDYGGPRGWIPRRRWEDETNFETICLEAQSPSKVDRENGVIEGISILTTGEAKGHQMMISQKTLESSITLMLGKAIPAYLSHAGASGDRLLTEAGYFSGFYRDKDRIRASRFTALESFKKYDREKFERLFEIAEVAPETFGVSIVFEGQLFWEMSDGTERTMEVGLDAPENARFDLPTVRPLKITSADFVDTPAANGALFSKVDTQPINRDMNTGNLELETLAMELERASNESASSRHATDDRFKTPTPPAPEPEPEPAKKKAKKKKALAEQDEEDKKDEERGEEEEIAEKEQGDEEPVDDEEKEDADKLAEDDPEKKPEDEEPEDEEPEEEEEMEEPEDEYQEKMRAAVEEVYSHMENALNRLREVMDMTGVPDTRKEEAEEMGEIAELRARVDELTKLHAGTAPIKEPTAAAFGSVKDAKKHLIEKHLELHPGDTRSTAVLAVAKKNPELFQQN